MVNRTAAEVVSALSPLPSTRRFPWATLEQMIYAYPTFPRGIQDAVRDLRANT